MLLFRHASESDLDDQAESSMQFIASCDSFKSLFCIGIAIKFTINLRVLNALSRSMLMVFVVVVLGLAGIMGVCVLLSS